MTELANAAPRARGDSMTIELNQTGGIRERSKYTHNDVSMIILMKPEFIERK